MSKVSVIFLSLVLCFVGAIFAGGQGTTTVVGGSSVSAASVGAACGSAGQVIFNSAGSCAGVAGFTFAGTTLTIGQSGVSAGTLSLIGAGGGGSANLTVPSNAVLSIANGQGTLRAGAFLSQGGPASLSGCANSTVTGGATAGSYVSVTAGSCTVTVTMGSSVAATTGWVCDAHDITTAADANNVTLGSLVSTSQATLVEGTVTANDVIVFKCSAY